MVLASPTKGITDTFIDKTRTDNGNDNVNGLVGNTHIEGVSKGENTAAEALLICFLLINNSAR